MLIENTRLLKTESCSIPQIGYRGNKHGIIFFSKIIFDCRLWMFHGIAVRTDGIISLIGTEFCNKECSEFIRTVLVFQR